MDLVRNLEGSLPRRIIISALVKMAAELGITLIAEGIETPAAHWQATAYLQSTYEMSQRRACRVIATDRTSVRYQATRPDDGALPPLRLDGDELPLD